MRVALRALVAVVPFMAAGVVSAQKAAQNPVRWQVTDGPVRPVSTGMPFGAAIVATIAPGWRLYAMEEPDRGPVPTEFTVPADTSFELLNVRGDHPLRHFDPDTGLATTFYEGQASFLLRFKARSAMKAGAQQVSVSVRYQACNATMCLPPKTEDLHVPLVTR